MKECPRYPGRDAHVILYFGSRWLTIADSGGDEAQPPLLQWPTNPKVVLERELARNYETSLNCGWLDQDDFVTEPAVTAWLAWRDLPAQRKIELIQTFQRECDEALAQIESRYSSVYGSDKTQDAKLLLRIFLSLPKNTTLVDDLADFGSRGYYQRCKDSRDTAICSAEQLDCLIQQLGDCQSLAALQQAEELIQMFSNGRFETPARMLYTFLRQQLGSKNRILNASVRRHAFMALVPLLHKLSTADSKLLVYALYSDHRFCEMLLDGPMINPWVDQVHYTKQDGHPTDNLRGYFSCALPRNIIKAMIDFMLDGRFVNHPSIEAFEHTRLDVLPLLCEQAIANPSVAGLVHAALGRLIDSSNYGSRDSFKQWSVAYKSWQDSTMLFPLSGEHAVDQRRERLRGMYHGIDGEILDRR